MYLEFKNFLVEYNPYYMEDFTIYRKEKGHLFLVDIFFDRPSLVKAMQELYNSCEQQEAEHIL